MYPIYIIIWDSRIYYFDFLHEHTFFLQMQNLILEMTIYNRQKSVSNFLFNYHNAPDMKQHKQYHFAQNIRFD